MTCCPNCSVFAPLSSCGPVYLGSCLVLCVSALASCLFPLPQVTLVARVSLFVLCDCSACFQLCEITFTASFRSCLSIPISPHCHEHCVRSLMCSPEGGPCHSSLVFVFVFLNVGVVYWFLKAHLLLEQFSLHPTFGCSPLHSTHLL